MLALTNFSRSIRNPLKLRGKLLSPYRIHHTLPSAPINELNSQRKYIVLSIDGGGIRGIIPAVVLCEIEKRTGKPISELFDYMGGTSTGGILALGLLTPEKEKPTLPKYKANDLLNFYEQRGAEIFPPPLSIIVLAICFLFPVLATYLFLAYMEDKTEHKLLKHDLKFSFNIKNAYATSIIGLAAGMASNSLSWFYSLPVLAASLYNIITILHSTPYDPTTAKEREKKIRANGGEWLDGGNLAYFVQTVKTEDELNDDLRLYSYVLLFSLSSFLGLGIRLKAGPFIWARYGQHEIEAILREYFGETTKLSCALKDVLITSYDIKTRTPVFMTRALSQTNPNSDLYMWQAARATSAAPTYFNPLKIKNHLLVDGGIFVNNPAGALYSHIVSRKEKNILLISLGTGVHKAEVTSKYNNHGLLKWGWGGKIVQTMMEASSNSVDMEMKLFLGDNYKRVQVSMDSNIKLDDTSKRNIQTLKSLGSRCIKENEPLINEICTTLMQQHQIRQQNNVYSPELK
ncbi:MAG: patatin [Gammaproteobacteria bacterium]|nr:patatin [Gammaproteobacteria bacterium]